MSIYYSGLCLGYVWAMVGYAGLCWAMFRPSSPRLTPAYDRRILLLLWWGQEALYPYHRSRSILLSACSEARTGSPFPWPQKRDIKPPQSSSGRPRPWGRRALPRAPHCNPNAARLAVGPQRFASCSPLQLYRSRVHLGADKSCPPQGAPRTSCVYYRFIKGFPRSGS